MVATDGWSPISNDPLGRMIASFPDGSLRVPKVKPMERSGNAFLGAVDLITNNGDVAADIMLGGGLQRVETRENKESWSNPFLNKTLFVSYAERGRRK
jgi:hypothetical protein